MAKITEHILNAKGKTLFSFEILPPLKGENIDKLFEFLLKMKNIFIFIAATKNETS